MQSGFLDGKVISKFEKHDLLTLYHCCHVKLFYSAGDHGQPRFYAYDLVRVYQMENNEGYDGGQKRDRIYSIMSTNVLMRETQDILSYGASTTALEHDC